jgi:hypothetical protein
VGALLVNANDKSFIRPRANSIGFTMPFSNFRRDVFGLAIRRKGRRQAPFLRVLAQARGVASRAKAKMVRPEDGTVTEPR